LIVDANQAWSFEQLRAAAPGLSDLGVELIEQPLPAGQEDRLHGYACPVPLCADESCLDRSSLPKLRERYGFVNIKLDKTGGLTEALLLAESARAEGFGIMVGCNVGTSLAMAPAMIVAAGAAFVDLDGPLLLAKDREPGLVYKGSCVLAPSPEVWG
jgi:L-alanine-DL-glutamate epimerase-like enolase superfamily enzyme